MDKSPRSTSAKKSGKSLKEKRVDKKTKSTLRGAADAIAETVSGARRKH